MIPELTPPTLQPSNGTLLIGHNDQIVYHIYNGLHFHFKVGVKKVAEDGRESVDTFRLYYKSLNFFTIS